MLKGKSKLLRMIFAAMFLAIALVLPFLTGQIPMFGKMLCPMHIPVLLCGFFCGPWLGAAVGIIAPIFRSLIFGMPQLFPEGIAMCFELCTYGLIAGSLYNFLPKKPIFVYVSLIGAMLTGRAVWGIVRVILYGVAHVPFGWMAFLSSAFLKAFPGIVLQIILIPLLVIALRKPLLRLNSADEKTNTKSKANNVKDRN